MRFMYRNFVLAFCILLILISSTGVVNSTPAATITPTPAPVQFSTRPVITSKNAHQLTQLLVLSVPVDDEILSAPLWSADGKILATVGSHGIYWFESDKSYSSPHLLQHSAIRYAELSNKRNLVASLDYDGTVRLWDLDAKLEQTDIDKKLTKNRRYIKLNPDGTSLALWGREGEAVEAWNLATGERELTLTGADWPAAFSPDGSLWVLSTLSANEEVSLFNAKTGVNLIKSFPQGSPRPGRIYSIVFSPQGNLVAIGGTGNNIWLWNVVTQEYRILETRYSYGVLGMTFSPDGQTLVSWGESDQELWVDLWQVSTGRKLIALPKHSTDRVGVEFNPDSSLIVTWDRDYFHRERLWDTHTGELLTTLPRQYAATFNPRGNLLATANDDGTIILWGVR